MGKIYAKREQGKIVAFYHEDIHGTSGMEAYDEVTPAEFAAHLATLPVIEEPLPPDTRVALEEVLAELLTVLPPTSVARLTKTQAYLAARRT